MKHTRSSLLALVLVVTLLAGSVVLAVQDGDADQAFDMPQRAYQIEIDGKLYDLAVDKPIEVRMGDQAHQVTLRVKPYIEFQHKGLSFEYPQQFSCTLDDSDPALLMWDMSGGDATLMLQAYGEDLSVAMMRAMLIPGVKSQFAGLRVTEEDCEFEFGEDGKLSGTRLTINMPDAVVLQEIYVFSSKGKTMSLWLQDARDRGGDASSEYKQMVKRLAKTLTIEK
ncbi:MAG: hypothetical protein AAGB26_06700 [Planctomycetota bacterium]